MTPPTIRDARREDAPAMAEVIHAAYRGTGGWTTEEHLVEGARASIAEVEEYIADPEHVVLVAEGADEAEGPARVVGCCYVHVPTGGLAEFGLFAVDPRTQGGGLGGLLLRAAEERLREDGVDRLMIQVLQNRPELRAWYERRGFVPTGEVLAFPGQGLKVAGLGMDVLVKQLG